MNPREILQAALRRDRNRRMGVRVGTVTEAGEGDAAVNLGRSQDVRVPTGGEDAYAGESLLVLEMDGVLLPLGNAPVLMGGAPDVVSIP